MMAGDQREARSVVDDYRESDGVFNAQIAGALIGEPLEASCKMIKVYRRSVRANCGSLYKPHKMGHGCRLKRPCRD
jgi:hypothetical protein